MSLQTLKQSLIFALEGRLVDLVKMQVPNFERQTALNLEKVINDSYQIYPIEAHYPAFTADNYAFYLEPAGVNLIANNTNFSSNKWVRGSNNISVLADVDIAPNGTYKGDRVRWDRGTGSGQIFKTTLELEPGTTYTMQWAIALYGGEPGSNDVIRAAGDVVEDGSISLGVLEPFPQKMQLLSSTFTTANTLITSEQIGEQNTEYVISNVTATTLTITGWTKSTVADELVDVQVVYVFNDGNDTLVYSVTSNTATDVANSEITFTFDGANLLTDGVTNGGAIVLEKPPKQQVEIQIYVESNLSLSIGFIDVKERDFRTTPILQQDEIIITSESSLVYRESAIAGLENFTIFFEIQEWRGDGDIINIDNVVIEIVESNLQVTVDAITFTYNDLPDKNLMFALIVSSEQRKIEFYVNGVLEIVRTLTENVTASLISKMIFGTEGVRAIKRVFMFNQAIVSESTLSEGDLGTGDINLLFNNRNIIDNSDLAATNPSISSGPVTIPAKPDPDLRVKVTSVNNTSSTITVSDATGIAADDSILIVRPTNRLLEIVEEKISYHTVESVSGNSVVLDSSSGININDYLILGNYDQPGIASIRFEYDPIDLQVVEAIDVVENSLTLSTVAAFNPGKAYLRNDQYQETAEVLVESKNEVDQKIFVNNTTGISVDDFIAQPESELLVFPANYFVTIANPVEGISPPKKYINGVVFENNNDFPVTIEVIIRVNL